MNNLNLKYTSGDTELWWGDRLVMTTASDISERALAKRVMDRLSSKEPHILLGGLGFGYTADEFLKYPGVTLEIAEKNQDVIEWMASGILPNRYLCSDNRVSIKTVDFFDKMKNVPQTMFDAVALDIDSYPYWIDEDHAWFYTKNGINTINRHLKNNGVFGLWAVIDKMYPLDHSIFSGFQNVAAYNYETLSGLHMIIVGEKNAEN